MLFSSIFRNDNDTLLYITNTPRMLYAACPEKLFSFWGGGLGPLFLNFLDLPLKFSYHTIYLKNITAA